jgi:cell division protein FtsW
MEIFKPLSFDKALASVIFFLLAVGFIMVYSTTAVLASERYHQSLHFFFQQLLGAGAGVALVILILSIRKPFYQYPVFIYGLLSLSLFLLVLCFVMPSLARVNRWVVLFGIRFQPSELAKISLVLFLAHYLEKKKGRLQEWQTLIFPLFVIGLFTLLILKEPDFGTALLVFFICALMLYLGGARLLHLGMLGLAAAAFFAILLFQASYRIDRIAGFMSPDKDPLGRSYQPLQSKLAVGSGGLLGVSLGFSTQKLYFLPYAHTDFIYAILGEEFGLLGTVTILFFFFVLLWRGLAVAARAPTLASQLTALGLTLMITVQALLNVSVVLGIAPPKGIPLPFISFGRSSLLCNLAAVGIILNISQRKGNTRKKI